LFLNCAVLGKSAASPSALLSSLEGEELRTIIDTRNATISVLEHEEARIINWGGRRFEKSSILVEGSVVHQK